MVLAQPRDRFVLIGPKMRRFSFASCLPGRHVIPTGPDRSKRGPRPAGYAGSDQRAIIVFRMECAGRS